MYISRLKFQKSLNNTLSLLKQKKLTDLKTFQELKGNSLFTNSLKNILKFNNRLYAEKEIVDFELACEKDLAQSKTITRLGPMLGLMGTLIPMGPALVGLAAGDIASMAQNMQVAFSTTVVGLFAGALGYVLQLIKQRWYIEDLNNLEFIFNVRYNDENCKAQVQFTKEQIYN
jgi:biopolymer transport protein ExbB/TolQ